MKLVVYSLLLLWPAALLAQESPADRARAASDLLDEASVQLDSAQSARDRVRALTRTISAFEDGLRVLRSGLRQAATEQQQLSAKLQGQEQEIASLLAALQRLGGTSSPVLLLHPGGPTGSVRAGMLLTEVIPALNAQVAQLRRDYADLQALQTLQTSSAKKLQTGLTEVQTARDALNVAIADRADLPKKFVADPIREAILLSSAETLDKFAQELDQISSGAAPKPLAILSGEKGALALPVQGQVLRAWGEADDAGITRPGIIVATQPEALVTSPVRATLRYVGPLLDYGQVVILEPKADVLFVFAGLTTVFGETGELIDAEAPLGLMGDANRKSADELSTDGDETGYGWSETLYIEVRQYNTPEDPSLWFRTDRNG